MEMQPLRAGGELSEIIDRYQSQVYGLALAKTGSRSDAEDVFQEVFLAYFQSGKVFGEEEHRKAWLLRTTINLCRRVTQSSWRKKTVPLTDDADTLIPFREPEENQVWQALTQLEETYRLPIYLSTSRSCPPGRLPGCCPSAQVRCACACPVAGSSSGSC